MKNCTKCKYAKWKKGNKERLHPSGDGECKFPYKIPALPASKFWIDKLPIPYSWSINRRTELEEHCIYYKEENLL